MLVWNHPWCTLATSSVTNQSRSSAKGIQKIDLFLTAFRRTPNGEGLDQIGGQHRKGLGETHP